MNTVRSSSAVAGIVVALAKMMMVMGGAVKDAKNPFFNSKYADLESVRNTILQAMKDAGVLLLIQQYPSTNYAEGVCQKRVCVIKDRNGNVIKDYDVYVPCLTVTTRITDPGTGEWQESDLSCYPAEDTPQAIGSAITYLRRYSLMPIFNIAPADDDGNAASGKTPETAQGSNQAPRGATSRPASVPAAQAQVPATPAPTEAPANRAMSAEERTRLGLITAEQFDSLKKLLSAKKINPKAWKVWLQLTYGIDSLSNIQAKNYSAIVKIVTETPSTINNFVDGSNVPEADPLPEAPEQQ